VAETQTFKSAANNGRTAFTIPEMNELTGDRHRLAEQLHEVLGASLTVRLSSSLRCPVTVVLEKTGLVGASRLPGSVRESCCWVTLRVSPDFRAAIVIPDSLSMEMVERSLGSTNVGASPSRPLTSLETRLIQSLVTGTLPDFRACWGEIKDLDLTLEALHPRPALVRVFDDAQELLLLQFRVETSTSASSLQILVPLSALRPVLDLPGTAAILRAESGDPVRAQIRENLMKAEIDIDVRLAESKVSLSDLNSLTPGRVLVLDVKVDTPVEAAMRDSVVLVGQVLRDGNKRLFRLTETPA
jgi:flagellar motor switch protein FliM